MSVKPRPSKMGICSSTSEKAKDPSSPYRSSQDEIKINLIHSEPIHCLCVADSTHLITASVDKVVYIVYIVVTDLIH